MGGSRRIRARRQRRSRARRRWQYAISVFVQQIIVLPLQARRRYPLGFTPVVVDAEGPDVLDGSVRDLSHLIDPMGY